MICVEGTGSVGQKIVAEVWCSQLVHKMLWESGCAATARLQAQPLADNHPAHRCINLQLTINNYALDVGSTYFTMFLFSSSMTALLFAKPLTPMLMMFNILEYERQPSKGMATST